MPGAGGRSARGRRGRWCASRSTPAVLRIEHLAGLNALVVLPARRLADELARDARSERIGDAIVDDDEFASALLALHHEPIEPHRIGARCNFEDVNTVRRPAVLQCLSDAFADASHDTPLLVGGFERLAAILNASAGFVVELSDERARGRVWRGSLGATIDASSGESERE